MNHTIFNIDRSAETCDRVSSGGIIVAVDKRFLSFEVVLSTIPVESLFDVVSLGDGFKVINS